MKIICDFTSNLPSIYITLYLDKSEEDDNNFITLNVQNMEAVVEKDIQILKMKYADFIDDVNITDKNFNEIKLRMFMKIFSINMNTERYLHKPLNQNTLQWIANDCYKTWSDIKHTFPIFENDSFEVKDYRRN